MSSSWWDNRSRKHALLAYERFWVFVRGFFRYVKILNDNKSMHWNSNEKFFSCLAGNVIWNSNWLRITSSTCCWALVTTCAITFVASKLSSKKLKLLASSRHWVATEKCSLIADGQASFLTTWNNNRWMGTIHSIEAVATECGRQEKVGIVSGLLGYEMRALKQNLIDYLMEKYFINR
jgi:hypothetical protein